MITVSRAALLAQTVTRTVGLSPPDLTTDTSASPQLKSSSDEASESSSSTTVKLLPKKRATKAEKIDRVLTGVVESIVTAQLKSDLMFLEHEEKRLECEERQRERDREFRDRMYSIMMGAAQPIARAPVQSASPATTVSQYYYPQPGFPPTSFW